MVSVALLFVIKKFVVAIQMAIQNWFQLPFEKCGLLDGDQIFLVASE
jgi:hypothetical protein